jgi:multimeric flavodoxin WrbA
MPRILAIAASARRKGNSDALLACALEGIKDEAPNAEVETIVPYGLPLTPCRSCNGCWKTGRCVVKDEMQQLYPKFCEADHIVVASPIYFTSLPGHFKVMIDRFQCFWARMFLLKDPLTPRRTGMFLCVGAMNRDRYYESTLTIIRSWMLVLNMGCPVSRFYPGLDEKDDTQKRGDYQQDAREAGAELIRLSRDKAAE